MKNNCADKNEQWQKFLLQRELIKQKRPFHSYRESLAFVNKKSIIHGLAPLNLTVQVSINIGCNANCIMCDRRYDPNMPFSYDSVVKIMDYLDSETVAEVKILGGEPLLDKPGLLNVVQKGSAQDTPVSIVTNGWLLDEAYVDTLMENGIKNIVLSVDALGGDHDRIRGLPGSFGRIERIIRYMKEQYPDFIITINSVLMKKTIGHALDVANWADQLGVQVVNYCRVEDFNKNYETLSISDDEYCEFYDHLSRIKLSASVNARQQYCDMREKTTGCDYFLHRMNVNDRGEIASCLKEDRLFYLDRPIKELYKDQHFRDFILSKINECMGCGGKVPIS